MEKGAQSSAHDAEDLARREKEASRSVELGAAGWVLLGCVVAYLVSLVLPFAGAARGWQVLAATGAAREAQLKATEFVFAWLSFLGVGVLTSLTLATRRFAVAVPAWMATTVAFIVSILAIWLRRTSSTFDMGLRHGPGIYLAIAAVGVAVFAFIPVVLRRSAAQADIAQRRASADGRDAVAVAQQSAAVSRGDNPLLVDDRRARAAERHRRHG